MAYAVKFFSDAKVPRVQMTDYRFFPENATSRLRWLMLSRVAIVTFLLGVAAFVEIKGMQTLSAISASTLFKTILLTYILSIVYLFLLKYVRNLIFNIYVQSLCDVILITGMVYATGGIQSLYSVFIPWSSSIRSYFWEGGAG